MRGREQQRGGRAREAPCSETSAPTHLVSPPTLQERATLRGLNSAHLRVVEASMHMHAADMPALRGAVCPSCVSPLYAPPLYFSPCLQCLMCPSMVRGLPGMVWWGIPSRRGAHPGPSCGQVRLLRGQHAYVLGAGGSQQLWVAPMHSSLLWMQNAAGAERWPVSGGSTDAVCSAFARSLPSRGEERDAERRRPGGQIATWVCQECGTDVAAARAECSLCGARRPAGSTAPQRHSSGSVFSRLGT